MFNDFWEFVLVLVPSLGLMVMLIYLITSPSEVSQCSRVWNDVEGFEPMDLCDLRSSLQSDGQVDGPVCFTNEGGIR